MDLLNFSYISSFQAPLYIILGGIIGDGLLVIVGFLQSQGYIKNYWPAFYSFLGLYFTDVICYYFGRSKYFKKFKKKKAILRFNATMNFITGNKLLLTLFYSKFISGAKLFMNIYMGEKGIPQKKFLILNLLMAIFWSIVTWLIGYYSGEGFGWVLKYFESITLGVLVLIIIAIILFNLSKKTKKYLEEQYKK